MIRTARADTPVSAGEPYIQRGVELRKLGRNGDALVEFEQAYRLDPTPRARAQVALALQALGDWAGAELGLEDALRAAQDPWIALYRDALEGALATARAHLAWLWVDANRPSAELLLNGVAVHAIPLEGPIRVVVGTLDIEVRAPGAVPAHRRIDVLPGASLHETLVLEAARASTDLSLSALRPTEGPGPLAWTPPARSSPSQTVGYIAAGGAAALAGAGVVAWRVREGAVATYNDDARCRVGALTRAERCGGFAQTADIALGLEIGAFAGAGISAVLSAWLFSKPRAVIGGAATWCAPSAAGGAVCGGSF